MKPIGTIAVGERPLLLLMESEVDSIYSRDRFPKCYLVLDSPGDGGGEVWRT
jgi:hypothetical protein